MFNPEQIKEMLNNKNVVSCSYKSITFSGDFKINAVRQYYDKGYSPSIIFEEAGFDLEVIGKSRAKDCLIRWRKAYNNKGEQELREERRGEKDSRKSKMKFKNDKEKIKYLEAKIAYMNAENDFLAKLRGLQRK
jgi:transposase-like protein